jgi:hypothetical protein
MKILALFHPISVDCQEGKVWEIELREIFKRPRSALEGTWVQNKDKRNRHNQLNSGCACGNHPRIPPPTRLYLYFAALRIAAIAFGTSK